MIQILKNKFLELGTTRLVILLFLMTLFILAFIKDMPIAGLLTDSILRFGRSGILVLALVPAVRGGTGLNFGLPLGILCGLVAMILGLEWQITGLLGFVSTLVMATALACIVGYLYGLLLNAVKGDEMTVGTYMGFATVSLMCIFWTAAPFSNRELVWTIGGKGLRTTISLENYYLKILDNFLSFSIGQFTFPTGLILFFAFMCGLVFLFFKTKMGIKIMASGQNPKCAEASGVIAHTARIQATIVSTVLASIGIVVYNQSFGFVQLYNAPLLMAFSLIACLLIGGGSVKTANIFHVVFGTAVFQTLLTVALPVTSQYVEGDISEVARVIISYGIILYALTALNTKAD